MQFLNGYFNYYRKKCYVFLRCASPGFLLGLWMSKKAYCREDCVRLRLGHLLDWTWCDVLLLVHLGQTVKM